VNWFFLYFLFKVRFSPPLVSLTSCSSHEHQFTSEGQRGGVLSRAWTYFSQLAVPLPPRRYADFVDNEQTETSVGAIAWHRHLTLLAVAHKQTNDVIFLFDADKKGLREREIHPHPQPPTDTVFFFYC